MSGVLDADTHIAEPVEMWDHLDPEWHPRRPVVVTVPDDTLYQRSNHMWLIDGSLFPRAAGKGGMLLVTPIPPERRKEMPDDRARELLDLDTRFADMDRGGCGIAGGLPHALSDVPDA